MRDLMKAWENVGKFVPYSQWRAITEGCRGEEGDYFRDKLREFDARLDRMPSTYETQDHENPLAWLHYFTSACDWWIVEKDSIEDQQQMFGLCSIGYNEPELGYISLQELRSAGAELDLHFQPTSLSIIREKQEARHA